MRIRDVIRGLNHWIFGVVNKGIRVWILLYLDFDVLNFNLRSSKLVFLALSDFLRTLVLKLITEKQIPYTRSETFDAWAIAITAKNEQAT
jgi:hypothetical protein